MRFATTQSGLAVPASLARGARHQGVVAQRKGGNNAAPAIPDGFAKDLKNYGERMGRRYEPRWNARHQCWVIWAEDPSTGGWVEAVAVYDKEHWAETGEFRFQELDRRVIAELYGSDLFVKFNESDPEIVAKKADQLMRECDRAAKERILRQAEDDFMAIRSDAWNDHARIKAIVDYGHANGFKAVHQVPQAAPVKEG